MVSFSPITDAELAVNKPITSSLMFRLRDNPTATFETHEGIARASVNFNGTGVLAIRDSYNVTSVTDNGTGDYTINFTATFNNANYTAVSNYTQTDTAVGGGNDGQASLHTYTTSSLDVFVADGSGIANDPIVCNVIVLGGQ